VIGATNVGDDKYEQGTQVQHPFNHIASKCPDARAMDLYAGCPGFNVAVELVFVLSLTGALGKGDLAVIIGAENIHRAKAFKETDTANIIFGDDAVATALETTATRQVRDHLDISEKTTIAFEDNYLERAAAALLEKAADLKLDGIIVDNQLGQIQYRVPATAALLQQRMTELKHPAQFEAGIFNKFNEALNFYDTHVDSFAFDIRTLDRNPATVSDIARAYVTSGKYTAVASVYLDPSSDIQISIFKSESAEFDRPESGVVDTITRTHGCFGDFIHAIVEPDDLFGEMDGKGVFLYATRSAVRQLSELLGRNDLNIQDIDLLIEHQANFAMIPLTLNRVFQNAGIGSEKALYDFIADKMVMNIHTRGNCSVVCMQRLPYDLQRGVLAADKIQGFAINRNLEQLKEAKLILFDSVGAGMTRSSFIYKVR
jgi:3-oxoacyl-[acyl-carrier-protein] synthase III